MKLIIDIPEEDYIKANAGILGSFGEIIANGIPYDEKLQVADEVWKLYEKHHSHLATHVIEFGDELKELLGKYQKEGEE